MKVKLCFIFLVWCPVALLAWSSQEDGRNELGRRGRHIHYHSKRMLPNDNLMVKRRSVTKPPPRSREMRKKPSGHLTPIEDEEMVNDEVVSVAINPPLVRPKLDRTSLKKYQRDQTTGNSANAAAASGLLKEVFVQLGQDFMMREVNENFVFGQYVGNAMKNLSSELRVRMQHDILDLIVKYQRMNSHGNKQVPNVQPLEKVEKVEVKPTSERNSYSNSIGLTGSSGFQNRNPSMLFSNDTDDQWGDFTSLAKLVG